VKRSRTRSAAGRPRSPRPVCSIASTAAPAPEVRPRCCAPRARCPSRCARSHNCLRARESIGNGSTARPPARDRSRAPPKKAPMGSELTTHRSGAGVRAPGPRPRWKGGGSPTAAWATQRPSPDGRLHEVEGQALRDGARAAATRGVEHPVRDDRDPPASRVGLTTTTRNVGAPDRHQRRTARCGASQHMQGCALAVAGLHSLQWGAASADAPGTPTRSANAKAATP
jgi:hypothetical protein